MKKIYIEPQTEERKPILDIVLIGASSEQDPWADTKDRDVYYEEEQEEFYLMHQNSSSNKHTLW